MRLFGRETTSCISMQIHMILKAERHKVVRIATGFIVAGVMKLEAIGDRAERLLVVVPVRNNGFSVDGHHPVAMTIFPALIIPATRFSINLIASWILSVVVTGDKANVFPNHRPVSTITSSRSRCHLATTTLTQPGRVWGRIWHLRPPSGAILAKTRFSFPALFQGFATSRADIWGRISVHSVPPDWVSRTGQFALRRCLSLPQLYAIGGNYER